LSSAARKTLNSWTTTGANNGCGASPNTWKCIEDIDSLDDTTYFSKQITNTTSTVSFNLGTTPANFLAATAVTISSRGKIQTGASDALKYQVGLASDDSAAITAGCVAD
jgi:hypothetical protein